PTSSGTSARRGSPWSRRCSASSTASPRIRWRVGRSSPSRSRAIPACAPSWASLSADPGRAADAGAAEPAIPAGVLGEILLVVVLGVEELRRGRDLGGDGGVAARGEGGLIAFA